MGTSDIAPIAVIGAGCRFAGDVHSADDFWRLLVDGRDGIGDPPTERWAAYQDVGPDHATAARQAAVPGGFLRDIDVFDAAFFGLSPREAELMDPQQRLLLEVTWEALEHAGIPPHDLAGGDTGVFVGVGSDDYGRRMLEDLPSIEAWTGIGSAMCAAANRISYALDLHGPSVAVDTACSASLVATHLATQALRDDECRIALVGGVNLIVSPGLTLTLQAAGATAPDGRCKPFDAEANGYGRGEGGGVLVLKRLDDAERDGDRILAVIRGSAVHQDGRTGGIMAPNGDAQRRLLAEACRRAGVDPASVDYVEAHGTGTRLGDPLEAGAMSAVYGSGRPAGQPCLIGSVKPNIGHLEAGAGIASLIKATLALHHGTLPPSLNFHEPNPLIDWSGSGLRVVTEPTPWPDHDSPRRCGVSGFGYGGTIGHVVLEQAPVDAAARTDASAPGAPDATGPRLYPLSAGSPPALAQRAEALADQLTQDETLPLDAVGRTLAVRRSHLGHRAAIVATGRDELVERLRLIADGQQDRDAVLGSPGDDSGRGLVMVFSGHGAQWAGMGRDLLVGETAFAEVIDRLEPIFQAEIGFSPRQVLVDGDLESVDRIQTMIFAVQVGLAAVWRSYGVRPDAVIGHSVGELAAAVTSGALSLDDGARLSCRRSKLLRRIAGQGAMAMVALPFADVEERLRGRDDVAAGIAASPFSTVVSGAPEAVEELIERWGAEDVTVRRVASDVAFHSPQTDPLLADLAAAADDLDTGKPRLPMYSTALADSRGAGTLDGAYWATNLRQPVRLTDAVRAAVEDGYRAFLEVSAHPVVAHSIRETLGETDAPDAFVGTTLRRNQPERATLLAAAGLAHCHGIALDWDRLQPAGGHADLPGIPWQHRPHWHETAVSGPGGRRPHDPASHTLLGAASTVAGPSEIEVWRTDLDRESRPYPGSHTIGGVEIAPAAVYLTTFLGAGGADRTVLTEVSLRLPLVAQERREVQVVRDGSGLRLVSRSPGADGVWLVHATATAGLDDGVAAAALPRTRWRAAEPGGVREYLAGVGVPTMAFDWDVEELLRGDDALRARVTVGDTSSWAGVLDAAFSVAPTALPGEPVLRMVAGVDRVRVTGTPPAVADIHVVRDPSAPNRLDVRVKGAGTDGRAEITGLAYAAVDDDTLAVAAPGELVHELRWRELTADEDAGPVPALVLVGDPDRTGALAGALRAAGVTVDVADPAQEDAVLPGGESADVVLVAGPVPGADADLPEQAARVTWDLLGTAQRLLARDRRVRCLTTGVLESESPAALAQSPAWGLGRVLAGEYGEQWAGIVDLPAGDPAAEITTLLAVLRGRRREEVVTVRDGVARAARLVRTDREPAGGPLACRADGTYLVTGGLGVLGLDVARWLAERGARRIVLAGRTGLPARADWDTTKDTETARRIRGVRELEGSGVTVKVIGLDVADAAAVARALAPDALGMPPICGVVHAAGVLDNRMAHAVDEPSLRTVLHPKVDGAWALHRTFPPGSLDFFVLFSSCGQLLGLPGQASYGAANAFLDALATHRGDVISFGWTSWRGQGMAVNETVDQELRSRGTTPVSPAEAFAAWDYAQQRGPGHYPVLRMLPGAEVTEPIALLSEVAVAEAAGPAAEEDLGLAGLDAGELRERLLGEVSSDIAAEMRMPVDSLDPRRSLVEQGLDSVMTIVIRRRLEKRFGQPLPTALLWQKPSISGIADHLATRLAA
ncbi:acyltransferase domain-containing protein [Micromonospora sp. NBC_01392]|uniref:type I polyketide synthase n=1 Tax=Micromonospora sp. NBC_01392 TaxID=2903588 RepID=UPI003244A955